MTGGAESVAAIVTGAEALPLTSSMVNDTADGRPLNAILRNVKVMAPVAGSVAPSAFAWYGEADRVAVCIEHDVRRTWYAAAG